ncbi:MAG: PA14 domain-containing protein [Marinibacterium sp.]
MKLATKARSVCDKTLFGRLSLRRVANTRGSTQIRKRSMVAIRVLGLSLGVLFGTQAMAQVALTPAQPQPTGLKPGLAVTYAFPPDVKLLSHAKQALAKGSQKGKALAGLSYPEVQGGDALTSGKQHYVAARIKGFMKFSETGTYQIRVFSNDGVDIRVGGVRVGKKDERTPCSTSGWVKVSVAQAGWYPLDALWFQRWSNSCLEMDWKTPSGKKGPVPNSAFGYK